MKLGSLFDGSGGFPLSGVLNGIEPVWAAEVEPYPIAVTRSRFPLMKHYGDVSKMRGAELEPVDIVTFGSPCQDMSIAGKREGLKHEAQGDEETTRSGLFYEAIRIVKEMRDSTNGEYPKYAVWENVPGAFSSNKGYDFHAVLEALCSVCDSTVSIPRPSDPKRPDNLVWNKAGEIVGDNYSVAWRTLDAQYWGVPQRRKRIYLVADFTGRCAGEILFKPDSLRGNLPQGNETGQGVTADAVGGVDGSVGVECLTPWDYQSKRIYSTVCAFHTLQAKPDNTGQNAQAVIYSFDSLSSNSMKSSNPNSGCRAVDVAKCINTTYPDPSKNQGGVAVVQPLVLKERAGCDGGGKGALWSDKAFTLATNQDMSVIAVCQDGSDVARTLTARFNSSPCIDRGQNVIALQANGIDRADTVDRHAVCYPLNEQIILRHGALGKNTGFGAGDDGDPAYTLQANHPHAVCYQESVGALQARDYKGVGNQYVGEEKLIIERYDARGNGDGETAFFTMQRSDEYQDCAVASTQSACQYKSATDLVVEKKRRYIIRRLTPTECARLQGFPDEWGHLAPYNPADAEFWEIVRKTHAEINGKKYKPVKDIKKWYEKLHNDGAEYKMWGNGIALPCAAYVIRRISEIYKQEGLTFDT